MEQGIGRWSNHPPPQLAWLIWRGRPVYADSRIFYILAGITRDSVGAVLPAALVLVFRSSNEGYMGSQVSSPNDGTYRFALLEPGPFFVVIFRFASTSDTAGITWDSTAGTLDEAGQVSGVSADNLLAVR